VFNRSACYLLFVVCFVSYLLSQFCADYRHKLTATETLRTIATVTHRGVVHETARHQQLVAAQRQAVLQARRKAAHTRMRTTSGKIQLTTPAPPSPLAQKQSQSVSALLGRPAPAVSLAALFKVNRGFLKQAAVAVGTYDTEYLRVPGVSTTVESWVPPPPEAGLSAAQAAAQSMQQAVALAAQHRSDGEGSYGPSPFLSRPFAIHSLLPARAKTSLNLKEIISDIQKRADD
jgi:hypothetical protein